MSTTPTLDKYISEASRTRVNEDRRHWLKGLSPPLKIAEKVADVVIREAVAFSKKTGRPFSDWGPMFNDQEIIVKEVMRAWNPANNLVCCECLGPLTPLEHSGAQSCAMCRLRIAKCTVCGLKTLPATMRAHIRRMHGLKTTGPLGHELPTGKDPA